MSARSRGVLAALALSTALIFTLASFGRPAATAEARPPAPPPPQSFTMPADAPAPSAGARDTYSVTVWPVVWPVDTHDSLVTDGFGPRREPTPGAGTFHDGVDFDPAYGTPIHAVADGVVSESDGPVNVLGWHVFLESTIDGVPTQTRYGHMNARPLVGVGDAVHKGQVIGYVGSTGVSTGPHLHFGVFVGGVAIDPLPWLRDRAPPG